MEALRVTPFSHHAPLPEGSGDFRRIPRDILLIILAKIMVGPPEICWRAFRNFTSCCKKLAGPGDNRLYSDPNVVERTNDFILRLFNYYHRRIYRDQSYSIGTQNDEGLKKTRFAIERLVQSGRGLTRLSFKGIGLPLKALKIILEQACHFPQGKRLQFLDLTHCRFRFNEFKRYSDLFKSLADQNPIEVKIKSFSLLITPQNSSSLKDLKKKFTTFPTITPKATDMFSGVKDSIFCSTYVEFKHEVDAITACPYSTNLTSLTIVSEQLPNIKMWGGLTNLRRLKITNLHENFSTNFPVLPQLQALTLRDHVFRVISLLPSWCVIAPNITKLNLLDKKSEVYFNQEFDSYIDMLAHFPRLENLSLPCYNFFTAIRNLSELGLNTQLRRLSIHVTFTNDFSDLPFTFPVLEELEINNRILPGYIYKVIQATPNLNTFCIGKDIMKENTLAKIMRTTSKRPPGQLRNERPSKLLAVRPKE